MSSWSGKAKENPVWLLSHSRHQSWAQQAERGVRAQAAGGSTLLGTV